jgi:GNAT superfamily N-acetyltransferase
MIATLTRTPVVIRAYQPGDEATQVAIYNAATAGMPGFKPATVGEVARRFGAADFDPASKLYGVCDGRVVGYVAFSPNGRVSVPWSLPDAGHVCPDLIAAALAAMQARGIRRAWAAYRADWTEPGERLQAAGFRIDHQVVNFVAAVAELPNDPAPPHLRAEPLDRRASADVFALDPAAFDIATAGELAAAWWDGPYMSPDSFVALRDAEHGCIVAAGVCVINPAYADPTKIDSAMPCFRLGAVGTEAQRTKRVNGLFSYVARPGAENHALGRHVLGEAVRRCARAGIVHVAAQCRSDRAELTFYDDHFRRQQSFPVFVREL